MRASVERDARSDIPDMDMKFFIENQSAFFKSSGSWFLNKHLVGAFL